MRRLAPILTFALLLGLGCSGGGSDPAPQWAADFLLEDVNDTSTTFAQNVSPRDHLNFVSVWYLMDAG
jgi:hypothetical protein